MGLEFLWGRQQTGTPFDGIGLYGYDIRSCARLLRSAEWTYRDSLRAYDICHRYRRQLLAIPIDVEARAKPKGPTPKRPVRVDVLEGFFMVRDATPALRRQLHDLRAPWDPDRQGYRLAPEFAGELWMRLGGLSLEVSEEAMQIIAIALDGDDEPAVPISEGPDRDEPDQPAISPLEAPTVMQTSAADIPDRDASDSPVCFECDRGIGNEEHLLCGPCFSKLREQGLTLDEIRRRVVETFPENGSVSPDEAPSRSSSLDRIIPSGAPRSLRNCLTFVRGRIGELLVESLFGSHGFEVIPYGVERLIRGGSSTAPSPPQRYTSMSASHLISSSRCRPWRYPKSWMSTSSK